MSETPRAVLSVDFELFRHTPAYRTASGTMADETVGLDGVAFLQSAFETHGVSTTWFTVSELAETNPAAVESIARAGHEIGSHTRTHRLLSELDTDTRREEMRVSREALEAVSDAPVTGFRAPAFDIAPGHFQDLAAAGYEYDASVVASRSIPGWYGGEFELTEPAPATAVWDSAPPAIAELPTSVMPGLRLPLTGTWLRFFGPRYTILGMRLLARRGVVPVLYVHPWEFVDLPSIEGVPKRVYWHTGAWMRRAIERILATDFEFVTASEALRQADLDTAAPDQGPNGATK
ncbi:polysaccharide deacetylase family protein [Halodesulfurarchaeum sp. HSR-GB]|uniref:polysaccharide deacetylase family protein n=1 Tax=Halodesulfurarchaeum sp. HSR-GB TaxID=3074077 RepID=UPI00285D1CF7|nr:polysaccharide deacetylase family protein [Halodesulfurarchaeum sp. HSR-GB]MDR5657002.1 polysaccharide deacetylase family protein [Halodesulfurarchaeum sp. HSR-GB]